LNLVHGAREEGETRHIAHSFPVVDEFQILAACEQALIKYREQIPDPGSRGASTHNNTGNKFQILEAGEQALIKYRAGIFKKSMGAKHRGGIGFSYRPARLHRLAEFIPWNQFRGPINI
jgi:hypothetical protein